MAVQFYRETRSSRLPAHLKNQFDRAASSIALNLNEGWGRGTSKDRLRFYQYAFGSIREFQAIATLESEAFTKPQLKNLDVLAASTYKLLTS